MIKLAALTISSPEIGMGHLVRTTQLLSTLDSDKFSFKIYGELKSIPHWIDKFDWHKHESEINRFSNFKTKIDDIDLHFIYEKGSKTNSTPLLLCHGWPGSIVEFLKIIEKLSHPENFPILGLPQAS